MPPGIADPRILQFSKARAKSVHIFLHEPVHDSSARIAIIRNRNKIPYAIPLLLNGKPVDRVVACRDGSPARIIAPDPRWFAIQKLWMSDQKKRDSLKRPKDLAQGMMLLDAVAEAMPHYPLDAEFEASLPGELAPYFAAWHARRPEPALPLW